MQKYYTTYPYGDIYRTYTLGGYSDQKYDFTGKERDIETGLHYFGARYYDSDLGRWLQVDPLADKYPGWSPYNYCVNNPVRMVDPDGRIVLFFNGLRINPNQGAVAYWGGFAYSVSSKLHDRRIGYINMSNYSLSSKDRREAGYKQGLNDAKDLFNRLSPGETIKLVSHSMGAAYSNGYAQALIEYALKNNKDTRLVQARIDFQPYQPGSIQPVIPTLQLSCSGDAVSNFFGLNEMEDGNLLPGSGYYAGKLVNPEGNRLFDSHSLEALERVWDEMIIPDDIKNSGADSDNWDNYNPRKK